MAFGACSERSAVRPLIPIVLSDYEIKQQAKEVICSRGARRDAGSVGIGTAGFRRWPKLVLF